MRRPRLFAVAAVTLALASPAAGALAQVNNGVGIGPSSELERPDLQRQTAHPASGTASVRHAARNHRSTAAAPPADDRPR